MPLTYSRFAILVFLNNIVFGNGAPTSTSAGPTAAAKAILDPKRRNDLVDEAFLEQKDVLLDMLEAKLKEVRDKKQKRSDTQENGIMNGESNKCGVLPANVDLKLQASGIIAVGETDVHLKFKDSGNSDLNLNASGISNVGKTNLKLGIGDGTVNIPGFENLFLGSTFVRGPCENRNATGSKQESPPVLLPNIDTPNEDNDTTYRKNIKTTNITNSTSTNKPLLLEATQSNDTQNVVAPNAVNVQNVIPAA